MENQKQYPMTQEGYEKLEQELEELKTVKRPEVVEKIKVARSFGDLSFFFSSRRRHTRCA